MNVVITKVVASNTASSRRRAGPISAIDTGFCRHDQTWWHEFLVRNPKSSATVADVFVHRHGLCESQEVGAGTRIWAFAHVMPGAVVGRDCSIGDHAFVETGARIGDRVTIKNQVMVWDGVDIWIPSWLGVF